MTPKILITGASGYLAHRLLPIASGYGDVIGVARSAASVDETYKAESLDLTDTGAVNKCIARIKPDVVIHAAASNPGSDEATMDAVNHRASHTIAQATADAGCRLVMVSTDMVHAGDAAPYADNAAPAPINTYGRTKALGEHAALTANPQAVIVRTSLIYGLEKLDRGTAGFVERLADGEMLALFNDVLRQPVWIDSLSEALCKLAVQHVDVSGVMNAVGEQVLSRAEFALLMLRHWSIDAHANILQQSGAQITGLPVDLRCESTRARALGFTLPGVAEVLSAYP